MKVLLKNTDTGDIKEARVGVFFIYLAFHFVGHYYISTIIDRFILIQKFITLGNELNIGSKHNIDGFAFILEILAVIIISESPLFYIRLKRQASIVIANTLFCLILAESSTLASSCYGILISLYCIYLSIHGYKLFTVNEVDPEFWTILGQQFKLCSIKGERYEQNKETGFTFGRI